MKAAVRHHPKCQARCVCNFVVKGAGHPGGPPVSSAFEYSETDVGSTWFSSPTNGCLSIPEASPTDLRPDTRGRSNSLTKIARSNRTCIDYSHL